MDKEDLHKKIKEAEDSENKSNFFASAHHYKDALIIARKLNDSESIKSCKKKLVEMNQKSDDFFKKLSTDVTIPNEEFDKVVDFILDGNLDLILKKIGGHPYLLPRMEHVEKTATKTIPIVYQIASLSTISNDGNLVKGGENGDLAWKMKVYSIHQNLIDEILLKRIFERLSDKKFNFNEKTLMLYLRSKKTFPEKNLNIIETGISRYFNGDYISALHILIPQFENIFLFMSEKIGIDTLSLNRTKDISTQLKTLSSEYLSSEEFQTKWGRDLCEQIKFVLFEPLGYTLRHKIAHGQIIAEECNKKMANLIIYFLLVLAVKIKINSN